jgi:hypothetical protein
MTLKYLLSDRSTLDQFTILQRADVILKGKGGRYFGGELDPAEVERLMEGLRE